MSPQRTQRRRTKGWRMPTGAVYVGRPTKWGNPFVVGHTDPATGLPMGAADAVAWFRAMAERCDGIPGWDTAELAGRDLVCWCPLSSPCHADVLLELANQSHITKGRAVKPYLVRPDIEGHAGDVIDRASGEWIGRVLQNFYGDWEAVRLGGRGLGLHKYRDEAAARLHAEFTKEQR